MANYETQIVVIAAGPSGLSAAVQAAEDGAEVIVLEKAAAIKRQAEIVHIESPVRDSRANGSAERAVGTRAVQVRSLRHDFEYSIKADMS